MAPSTVPRIAIVCGSTRPNRVGRQVADWVEGIAKPRSQAAYELVDIADFDLPLLDEPIPPSQGKYQNEHTKAWAAKVARYDGFVFVTPEYNHATSGAMKNALDFLYAEWNNKAAGFVGYGSVGGTRAVENLRLVCAELQMATVRAQVALTLHEDFEAYTTFRPRPHHEKSLGAMLEQLESWTEALRTVRAGSHGAEHSRPPRPAGEKQEKAKTSAR